MNNERLDVLINGLKTEQPPPLPDDLERAVWQQTARRGSATEGWPHLLAHLVLRMPVAIPLVAGAALLGVSLAANLAPQMPSTATSYSRALDFDSITVTQEFELFSTR